MLVSILSCLTLAMTAWTRPVLVSRDGTNSTDIGPRYVVAHFMVGNAYPYTKNDWLADIKQASGAGIDAFALNIGSDDWQSARVADAYQAALESNTGFKLFISYDMTVLPCATQTDAAALRKYITDYAHHAAQFMYNGKPFASTFAGETCTFGSGSATQAWASQFKDPLAAAGTPITFVPSFFVAPNTFASFGSVLDGAYNWNSAWPITLTTASQSSGIFNKLTSLLPAPLQDLIGSLTPDDEYLSGLGRGKTGIAKRGSSAIYMASVSPTFFTHYGKDTYNKNWIYVSDDHLYATRWEKLIEARASVNLVEINTWNDYGESHYIGPIKGAQPNSQAWVDGFDHQGWLDLTSYYAQAFKTGQYPDVIRDKVVMWARPHSKNAVATNDNVGKPTNWELTTDTLWAVAILSAPGSVTLSTSPTNSKTFDNLPAGLNKLSIPLTSGGPLRATVTRPGESGTSVDVSSKGYTYDDNTTKTYNWNSFVVASP